MSLSIKSLEYRLPIVWPERYIKRLSSGANQPIVVSGVEENSDQVGDYVVKLLAGERMSSQTFAFETLACFMAMEMEIPVVEPVIVNIDSEFVESMRGSDAYQRIAMSKGLNFGSRYLSNGWQTFAKHQHLNERQLAYAKDIFWFDMLIQNPDRTFNKPNMLTDGREVVVLDHELAFTFLVPLIGVSKAKPWEVTRGNWPNFSDFILPPKLKKAVFDKAEVVEKLNRLDDEFWQRAHSLLPTGWRNDKELEEIKTHVTLVQQNAGSFVKHIQTMIS